MNDPRGDQTEKEKIMMENKGILLVVSGPAGSGKGTVLAALQEKYEGFACSVSATSRPRLSNEVDGVNYHYITREQFEGMLERGEMLEYTEYCGNYYGTPKGEADRILSTGKNLILEIEVDGAMQIKRRYPDAVLVMIIPPSAAVQEQRLRARARDSEEQIQRRLRRAHSELNRIDMYDYVLVNEDGRVEEVADSLYAISRAERNRASRRADVIADFFADEQQDN